MKKASVFLLVFLIVSPAVHSQLPPQGYVGLYSDQNHSCWCVNEMPMTPVEMWVWVLPGENGLLCAEFDVSFPSNVVTSTVTWNPDLQVTLPPSPCFPECQSDWNWIYHQLIYVTSEEPSFIQIIASSDDILQFTTCEEGYPAEPCIKITNLYLNYGEDSDECDQTPVSDSSWGCIKRLFAQ